MKDFSINNKTKVTAPTFPSLKIPKSVSATGYNKGKTIRNNIQGVLSKKYGGLDTKHIFDGIADIDIEKNIPVAETTIQTNVDRGFLDKNKLAKLPNLRDGLALSYAAADKGMNRAATRARDAAYMESNEPWLKETGTRLLSNDTSGMLKLESPFNINASKTADSKNESYAYKPKEEKTSGGDKTFGDVSSVQNPKIASSNNTGTTRIQPKAGIRFKAEVLKDAAKREELTNSLTTHDIDAGITVEKSKDNEYYYDYTSVVMDRINDVLPEFIDRKILSPEEYYEKHDIGLFPPDSQNYNAMVMANLLYFYEQVNHGAPWDIKRDDPWKQQFGDIKMPYYDSNPEKDETFLFRGEQVTREDLGNILYGYLGSAMGIGDKTLYWGAGVAASKDNIFNGKAYNPDEYYGDNKEDHEKVKKGIEMFYEDYPNAKAGINRTFP